MGFDMTLGLGSLLGSGLGLLSQHMTNRSNMKLAEYQYSKNLEQWNRENEYNTPSAQRQRLIDAGLNPGLMYGNGQVANTAGSSPQMHTPTLSAYTDFGDMGVSLALNALMTGKNAKNVEADTHKKEAETNSIAASQKLTEVDTKLRRLQLTQQILQNSKTSFEVSTMRSLYDLQVKSLEASIGRENAAALLSNAQAGYVDAETQTENELRPHRVSNERKKGKVLDTEATRNVKQGNAADAAAEASRASAQLSRAQSEVAKETAKKIREENKFLTYKQEEQLEIFIKMKAEELRQAGYKSDILGSQSVQEAVKAELDGKLRSIGVDPRNQGYSRIFDQALYGISKIIDLFR